MKTQRQPAANVMTVGERLCVFWLTRLLGCVCIKQRRGSHDVLLPTSQRKHPNLYSWNYSCLFLHALMWNAATPQASDTDSRQRLNNKITFCVKSQDCSPACYVIDTFFSFLSHTFCSPSDPVPFPSSARSPCLRQRWRSCTGAPRCRTASSPCWDRRGSWGSPLVEEQTMESFLLSRRLRGADSQWAISS